MNPTRLIWVILISLLPVFSQGRDLASRTVRIDTKAGRMKVKVLQPKETDGPVPGILWIHGGGYMHRPQDIEKVLKAFPAEDVRGIGRRMMCRLESMNVRTAWDYVSLPETTVRMLFHLPGYRTWKELKGIPCIALEEMIEPRKTICVSRSFSKEMKGTAFSSFTFVQKVLIYSISL